jgi:hypothetical protein
MLVREVVLQLKCYALKIKRQCIVTCFLKPGKFNVYFCIPLLEGTVESRWAKFSKSKVYLAVSLFHHYMYEDHVLNFILCFSFYITTISWRGTDRIMKK